MRQEPSKTSAVATMPALHEPGGSLHLAHIRRAGSAWALAGAGVLACMIGCGGPTSNPVVVNASGSPASLPTPPTPATTNTYIGTQSPGVWSLTLNDTAGTYSYQPVTFPNSPNTPATGSFTNSHGFLSLGQANGTSLGYILEAPGQMALLRPGDATAPLVVGVPQTSCYSIPYRLRFEYIGMQAANQSDQTASPIPVAASGSAIPTGAYGSFVVNTDTSGSAWTFQNLQGNAPYGPAGFSGACSSGTLSLSGEGLFNEYNFSDTLSLTSAAVTTMAMGPTGIFIIDQTDPTLIGGNDGSASVGVAEPSSPLTTSAVAAGQYLGFWSQAPTNGRPPTSIYAQYLPGFTSPVSFGQAASSGTTMTGGLFPNDDVTQTPNSDTTINLGAQSSSINGFYPSASVTTLDPNQDCEPGTFAGGVPGINAEGFSTCTFPAVAVAGNPEGKYVIFLYAFNYTYDYTGSAMELYLYQQ